MAIPQQIDNYALVESVCQTTLGDAWIHSQNIDEPWSPVGHRSTSVGDLMITTDEFGDNRFFIVASFGFDEYRPEVFAKGIRSMSLED